MSFFDAPTHDGPRELCPEGKHTGLLYSVVDCGSVNDTYEGETKVKHQLYLTWEFPEVLMTDGRPFVYGNFYNATDGLYGLYFTKTSNINKMLRGWTGFDEKACSRPSLLGKLISENYPVTITIAHEEGKKDPSKTFAVAESIKPYKGKTIPTRVNPVLTYALVDGPVPDAVPEWLKKRIASCLENTIGLPTKEPKPENAPAFDSEILF